MGDELPTSEPMVTSAVRLAARVDISSNDSETFSFPFGREYNVTGLKILYFRALLKNATERVAIQQNDPIHLVAEDAYKGFTVNAMEFRDTANNVLIKDIMMTLPFQHPQQTYTIINADQGGVLNFSTSLPMKSIAFKAYDVLGRMIYKYSDTDARPDGWTFTDDLRFDIGMQLTYEL